MILPSDADYVETKLINHRKRTLSPLFRELADWIGESYPGATVLNLYYDKVASTATLTLPRLSVIFETATEAMTFRDRDGNFDRVKQGAIATRFNELLTNRHGDSFDTHRLLVIFCAFEPVARLEAILSITPDQIAGMKAKLNDPAIWKVRRDMLGVSIFFYTDAQLATLGTSGFKAKCCSAYAEIITAYDEFGYLQDHPAQVTLDSKENFEKNYGGNWFNYDRR